MVEISTSILSVLKGQEAKTFFALEKAKTDYFHIDVMDGKFVEKNTYKKMFEYASYIKRISNIPLDVHLMVQDVKKAIDEFSTLEPNIITFHFEACKDDKEVEEYINLIKTYNSRIGISVKPETEIEKIYKFLPYIHNVLVMTVEPGKGGQELIPSTIEKIKRLKEYVEENQLDVDIEADGGINLQTAAQVKKAGANILVVGTALIQTENYKEMVAELKKE